MHPSYSHHTLASSQHRQSPPLLTTTSPLQLPPHFQGLVGAPACGDVMKLQIEVDATGRIVDSKFKTFGCGSAIASSSVATEWNTDIAAHLKLPPVKLHCSMLAEDAIHAAVKDWKNKQVIVEKSNASA
jgi:NifU-like protein involved in Fe-S cluster formation